MPTRPRALIAVTVLTAAGFAAPLAAPGTLRSFERTPIAWHDEWWRSPAAAGRDTMLR